MDENQTILVKGAHKGAQTNWKAVSRAFASKNELIGDVPPKMASQDRMGTSIHHFAEYAHGFRVRLGQTEFYARTEKLQGVVQA